MRAALLPIAALLIGARAVAAQDPPSACRILCPPEFKIEPTLTLSNLFGSPRVVASDGTTVRDGRESQFELILSIGLPTSAPWLGFTVEAIVLPFERDSTPELELEANFVWLPSRRTRGWVTSHVDIVDKFSAAERPSDRHAYTHKLNFELDTSLSIFRWMADGRWLRRVELEGSLDYVATGLPRAGTRIGDVTFIDNASPWSFSLVLVVPLAPL